MTQHAYTVRVRRHREQEIPIGSPDKGHTREENGSPDKKCNKHSRLEIWLWVWTWNENTNEMLGQKLGKSQVKNTRIERLLFYFPHNLLTSLFGKYIHYPDRSTLKGLGTPKFLFSRTWRRAKLQWVNHRLVDQYICHASLVKFRLIWHSVNPGGSHIRGCLAFRL